MLSKQSTFTFFESRPCCSCMADNDEDMHATHWVEDASFPMGILRKLLSLHAGPTGLVAGTGDGGDGVMPPPPPTSAPVLLKRASSTASADAYEFACSVLGPALGPSAPLWAALDRLRLVLGLKEKVHQQYVRVGTLAKLQVRGGVNNERSFD